MTLQNNVFWNVADGTGEGIFKISRPGLSEADSLTSVAAFTAHFDDVGNIVANPGISKDNPVPSNAQTDNLAPYDDSWFDAVNYKGAFGSENWAAGWTRYFSEK